MLTMARNEWLVLEAEQMSYRRLCFYTVSLKDGSRSNIFLENQDGTIQDTGISGWNMAQASERHH